MLGKNWQYLTKRLVASMLAASLAMGLWSCSQPNAKSSFRRPGIGGSKMAEVAPPPVIQELRRSLDIYQPQVKILSPQADEILQDTKVSVRLQVQDLPIFQDEALELGPHLHLILDNQPYGAVYDPKQPIVFDNLEPGTHTIRVFAASPWDESFKNEGAYAQTTFHLFAKTPENKPDLSKPLLTYSRPKESYGAEPILLDFYISNVPLHLVAQENPEDDIPDWQIRCTINGESFIFDRWEPIYLKGLKPGKNWVQMELLDDQGNPFPNAFNNTVRLINYQPGGQDSLSKLTRGEISGAIARSIIDPNYEPPAPEPEPIEKAEEPPILEPIPAKPSIPLPVETQEPPSKTPIPQKIEEKSEEKPDAKPADEEIRTSPVEIRPVPVQPRVQKPIEPPVIESPTIKQVPIPVEPVLTAPKLQVKEQPIEELPIAPQRPTVPSKPLVIKEPVEPDASPAPRSSEDVRQRDREKVDAATEKLDDTFDALRERSGKVSEDTQNFFKRFRKTPELSDEQKRAKGFLSRFQQPVEKINNFQVEPIEPVSP